MTSMLFARQRQLLQLLEAVGSSADAMDFQKLLFLYCQESAITGKAPYDFVPHELGAFSFTADADRRKLIERGLLANDEDRWQITDQGREVIGSSVDTNVAAVAKRHANLRGSDLAADMHRRFPDFALRSEASGPALCTIGYEGHSLESYLNRLIRAGVTLLCDVRRNPISRKYGFSKSTLGRGCEAVGIRYEHLPELGIASSQRRGLHTQADYDALFAEYERTSLPKQGEALEKVRGWIAAGQRVALTCYEHLPQQCHRHCVAEALEARFGTALNAQHL